MRRPYFLLLLPVAACGGKVLVELDQPSDGRPTTSSSGPDESPSHRPKGKTVPTVPPDTDGGVPAGPRLRTGNDYVLAYSGDDPSFSLGITEDVEARFSDQGSLLAFDGLELRNGRSSFAPWHAWGDASLSTPSHVHYAIGKQLAPRTAAELGPSSASFRLMNGGATTDQTEVSAECTLSNGFCKIAISIRTPDGRALHFVPAATVEGSRISGDALSNKSSLRGAFTCDTSCGTGRYSGFGMVIAWAIEDPATGAFERGAAALPFFDPR